MNLFQRSLAALSGATSHAPAASAEPGGALLSLDLSVSYRNKPDVLSGVKLDVLPGEIFGLVGESGSGKSTVALAILRLLDTRGGAASGSILFQSRDLMRLTERELRRLRGRAIALVPQSPLSAFNPALRFEAHFREAWKAHSAEPWRKARPQALDLLRRMDLPAEESFLRRYPHQVSVGQAQRLLIAMSVLHRPALLIADEPTSALDPDSRQGILDLLARLNREFAMAVLYISHDLPSVGALCRRVAVLHRGRLAASGQAASILAKPSSNPQQIEC